MFLTKEAAVPPPVFLADPRPASHAERVALMLAFAALVALRLPNVWRGRFWAEEGLAFFVNAAVLSWNQALLATVGGYLNLVANLAGVLAYHLVPLEAAPYVSTGIWLAFQICPAILLVSTEAAWLSG